MTRKLNFQALLKKLMMVFCLSLDFLLHNKFSNRIAIFRYNAIKFEKQKIFVHYCGDKKWMDNIGAGYIGNMLDAENQEGSRASKC